jgi:hypothetical protein
MESTIEQARPVVRIHGTRYGVADQLSPRAARAALLTAVLDAARAAAARAFVVKGSTFPGHTVGVLAPNRPALLRALAERLAGPYSWLQEVYPNARVQPRAPLTAERLAEVPAHCATLRVAWFWTNPAATLRYEFEYGVDLEFWAPDRHDADYVRGPSTDEAVQVAHRDLLAPAEITVDGQAGPAIARFERPAIDEVDFPVDAVYTWVDGHDPAWLERFQRAQAEAAGVAYHPEAQAEHRFVGHDELRFSMRSLQMYAPWIRHIYLVTDDQMPGWLAEDQDRVTVVDHRDIFTDPSVLPVFNSNAIISQLHHIDGLSEHYLYLNDDVFFGHDVRPEDFWFGSGLAKVFPSRALRAFGPATATDPPHVNISKNIRANLQREFGRTLRHAVRHMVAPQVRSVNYEIEQRFPDLVSATATHRFRHHDDVALDQMFHYYARMTARAVPTMLDYEYVNIGTRSMTHRLRRLLATRDRAVFCLNDAPDGREPPMSDEDVAGFLRSYFPVRAAFEVTGDNARTRYGRR